MKIKSDRIFVFTTVVSLIFHGVLIAHKTDLFKINEKRLVKIPVTIEQEEVKKPEPKPKPKPKPKHKPKPEPKPVEKEIEKPENLRKDITEVSESQEGLRSGELVDAPVGKYEKGRGTGIEKKPKEKVDVIAEIKKYIKNIREKTAKEKIYPVFAQRHGITGKVKVTFYVASDGGFEKITVEKSSGNEILDNAAVETLKKLDGKVERPEKTGEKKIKTSLTLSYKLI
ncbi:MAG: TonB family protein [bacterium]